MLLKQQEHSKCHDLIDCIKKELISTLQSKGISITDLSIEINQGNVNVSVSVCEKPQA